MKKRYNLTKVIITIILLANLVIIPTQAETEKQTKTQTPSEITPEKLRVNLTDTIPMNSHTKTQLKHHNNFNSKT